MLIVAALAALEGAAAQTTERKFILEVGGGLPAARVLTIELRQNGAFGAKGEGLPFTDSGLTKLDLRRTLSEGLATQIVSAAEEAAEDWDAGNDGWPDCKWATLEIHRGPKSVRVSSGCVSSTWRSRRSVQKLLAPLDQQLPAGWTVSKVLAF